MKKNNKYKIWIYLIIVSLFFTFSGWNLMEFLAQDGNKWGMFVYIFLATLAGFAIGASSNDDKN